MNEMDVVAWNSMIAGFALHSLSKEGFFLFEKMREEGIYPTQFSYASVVSSCTRLATLSEGRQVHVVITKDGYVNDVFVGSIPVDIYAKCSDVEEACQFFYGIPHKNIVSWNELKHGYAQNGLGNKVVELFEDMLLTEEKSDGVTFIVVLTAYSHSGLVDVKIRFSDSMEKEHEIESLADHYTCIIDSLGRAGRFTEAEVLIEKMSYKVDTIIWEVLFSSYIAHAKVTLGNLEAEHLFHLDLQNPAPYILLSNLYAALGRWDDASVVRKLMNDKGVVKDPDYIWIEFNNGVQAFMVDDDLRIGMAKECEF